MKYLLIIPVMSLLLAVPAHADADADYINELDKQGVSFGNEPGAIAMGQAVCIGLENGLEFPTISRQIESGGAFSSREAGVIIGAAAGALCPDEMPILQQQVARWGG